MQVDNIPYIDLLPLSLLQDMVHEFLAATNGEISEEDIAHRLIDYSINDA